MWNVGALHVHRVLGYASPIVVVLAFFLAICFRILAPKCLKLGRSGEVWYPRGRLGQGPRFALELSLHFLLLFLGELVAREAALRVQTLD